MISKQNTEHIAKLARLGLKEKEIKRFQKDLSSILDYFNLLKEVDVSKIEPTFHPLEHYFKEKLNVMRKDKAESQPKEVVDKLIELAPHKKARHLKVKSVFQ